MAKKKTATDPLEIAVEYLKKVAETEYIGSPDSEIVKRLRSFARQGLEAVASATAEKAEPETK